MEVKIAQAGESVVKVHVVFEPVVKPEPLLVVGEIIEPGKKICC